MSTHATRGQREASRSSSGLPRAKHAIVSPVKLDNGGKPIRIPGCYLGTNISYKTGKPKSTMGGDRRTEEQKRQRRPKRKHVPKPVYADFFKRKRFTAGCRTCEWLKDEYRCEMPYHEPASDCLNGGRIHCDCPKCW